MMVLRSPVRYLTDKVYFIERKIAGHLLGAGRGLDVSHPVVGLDATTFHGACQLIYNLPGFGQTPSAICCPIK